MLLYFAQSGLETLGEEGLRGGEGCGERSEPRSRKALSLAKSSVGIATVHPVSVENDFLSTGRPFLRRGEEGGEISDSLSDSSDEPISKSGGKNLEKNNK